MPNSPRSTGKAVTTKDVARHAGVSNATVSMALRNDPRITAPTRDRVQRAAAELGYRPDPQLAKLMFRLRSQRPPGFHSTIAAITTFSPGDEPAYAGAIIRSAEKRAHEMGYAFTVTRVPDADRQKPALQRMLLSRGVQGLLVLPLKQPREVRDWFDWEKFSVVATTNGVLAPAFHRVVPHQFGNTLTLCERLCALGYRRIGLAIPRLHDVTVRHAFTAAVAWQGMFGGTESVRPLVYDGALRADILRPWFTQEHPDVIIAPVEGDCRVIAEILKLTIPGEVGFVVATRPADCPLAGMDEQPDQIGAAAIELLHAKLISGNVGIPAFPTVAMVSGCWVAGPYPSPQEKPGRAG